MLGGAILSGIVYSGSDNKPIAGATVQIEGNGASAQTNPSGRFSLPGIPSGIVQDRRFRSGIPHGQVGPESANRQANEHRSPT